MGPRLLCLCDQPDTGRPHHRGFSVPSVELPGLEYASSLVDLHKPQIDQLGDV